MTFAILRRTIYADKVAAIKNWKQPSMKQIIAFLTLLIAFGASGHVFGIDTTPYVAQDEVMQPIHLEHFEAVID